MRIVGKLDKKIDDYQRENRQVATELKADIAGLKQDNAEIKGMLKILLSR